MGTLASSRVASILAVIAGAIILLAGGFTLAFDLRAHTPPQHQIEAPVATSPGAVP
jgi:hypothetical protein